MLFNLGCGYLGRVMPLTYNLLWIVNIPLSINKQIYLINVVQSRLWVLGSSNAFDLQSVVDCQHSSIYQ